MAVVLVWGVRMDFGVPGIPKTLWLGVDAAGQVMEGVGVEQAVLTQVATTKGSKTAERNFIVYSYRVQSVLVTRVII